MLEISFKSDNSLNDSVYVLSLLKVRTHFDDTKFLQLVEQLRLTPSSNMGKLILFFLFFLKASLLIKQLNNKSTYTNKDIEINLYIFLLLIRIRIVNLFEIINLIVVCVCVNVFSVYE